MTTPYRARWLLVILAFIVVFLQGCRREAQERTATAVPGVSNAPTPAHSVANSGLAAVSSPTPLPVPVTAAPTATAAAELPPVPTATPTTQESGQITIGFSVQNRPIIAYWAGTGDRKAAIIGGGETAETWATHYQNNPESIPADLTVWFLPDPNPDNADPNSLFNANGVNLYQNADGRFVSCFDQNREPEMSGPFPFSEPESQALRDLLADAWMTVLLTAEPDPIQPGGCGDGATANALASLLADNSGAIMRSAALIKGHFADYLVGEGNAAVVMGQEGMSTAVIDAMLANIDQVMNVEAAVANGAFQWVDATNSGEWQFPVGTFIHPLALEHIGQDIYVLDSGQVQRLNRQSPAMPEVILAPDDEMAGVRVIEPLDLATDGQRLFVLDRAGDVYAFAPETGEWSLRRYDRPVGETSSHYYVSLSAQPGLAEQFYLLESSYHIALEQQPEQPDFIWPLPENHQVDITVNQNDVYILSQSPISPTASLIHYENGARDNVFFPRAAIQRPRQAQAVGSAVYVLDNGGRRLTAVDAATGQLNAAYLPADGAAWSAFLVNEATGEILLAERDRLIFFGAPKEQAVIGGTGAHLGQQMNDPAVLDSLRGLLMPIGGSDITVRANQMPGAPRHYRYGVHEGADFYWQSGTPVRAAAAGTVIRATVDYQIPTQEMFDSWRFRVQTLGYTSAEAHDFYRGMQVWIEHEGGLISRYVHLSAIDSMIREGITVGAGQIIGAVGNTGSPVSLEGPDTDAHLHFELWLEGHYLGQFLRPIETREWLTAILNEQ